MGGVVQIVDYSPKYQEAFKTINIEWIQRYFKMEKADYKALDYPQEHILDNGGYIAIALLNNEPVGACSLMKMNNELYDYELAKMGVSPQAQGHGIGYKLGLKILEKAKELGAKTIFLESNTVLAPAIALYRKLGFNEIEHIKTPYQRCNIQMAIELQK